MRNGEKFSTDDMQTVHSGKGFAIRVAGGTPATFYAGYPFKGQSHHRSFVAGGGKVVCGGEIVASAGKVKLLSAKTGHYKAKIEDLVNAIKLLDAGGVKSSSYRVLVWAKDAPPISPVTPCPLAFVVLVKSAQFVSWATARSSLRIGTSGWRFNPKFHTHAENPPHYDSGKVKRTALCDSESSRTFVPKAEIEVRKRER